jgi:four helix bundle protein
LQWALTQSEQGENKMLKKFRTYELALQFHRECEKVRMPAYLRDQLSRATSSIVLNIAEGSGKNSIVDQRRFYAIALGSLREANAALDIKGNVAPELTGILDQLGACLYRLCNPKHQSATDSTLKT